MTAGLTTRCHLVSLPRVVEDRGSLCVAEVGAQVPFAIERVFWIFDVPGDATRASHAHREQHELLVAARGEFMVRTEERGIEKEYLLDAPDRGLLIPELVWVELTGFSAQALCLAFASGPYVEADNLRDHDEFRRLVSNR